MLAYRIPGRSAGRRYLSQAQVIVIIKQSSSVTSKTPSPCRRHLRFQAAPSGTHPRSQSSASSEPRCVLTRVSQFLKVVKVLCLFSALFQSAVWWTQTAKGDSTSKVTSERKRNRTKPKGTDKLRGRALRSWPSKWLNTTLDSSQGYSRHQIAGSCSDDDQVNGIIRYPLVFNLKFVRWRKKKTILPVDFGRTRVITARLCSSWYYTTTRRVSTRRDFKSCEQVSQFWIQSIKYLNASSFLPGSTCLSSGLTVSSCWSHRVYVRHWLPTSISASPFKSITQRRWGIMIAKQRYFLYFMINFRPRRYTRLTR